jgi:hypothetical protein
MDRVSKVLLLLIAIALWANLLAPVVHPAKVQASDSYTLDQIEHNTFDMRTDISHMKADLNRIRCHEIDHNDSAVGCL